MERKFVVVEPYGGYCGVGCVMSILNHFLTTSFSTKDTYDVLKLVKYHGRFEMGKTVDDLEMAYFLNNIGFKVELFLDEVNCLEKYAENPEKYLRESNIAQYPGMSCNDSAMITKKILVEKKISVVYDETIDVFNIVKQRQARNTLFVLGGDFYILRGEERRSGHHGHYVMCSGIRDEKFVIHDPGPDIAFEYLVDKETMKKAMQYYGGGESVMIVTYI